MRPRSLLEFSDSWLGFYLPTSFQIPLRETIVLTEEVQNAQLIAGDDSDKNYLKVWGGSLSVAINSQGFIEIANSQGEVLQKLSPSARALKVGLYPGGTSAYGPFLFVTTERDVELFDLRVMTNERRAGFSDEIANPKVFEIENDSKGQGWLRFPP